MGRLASAVGTAVRSTTSSISTPEKWLANFFQGGQSTPAGVRVNEETALRWSPYFDGIRIISEDLGSLPLHLYRRLDPRGKERAQDHHLYDLLHKRPNPLMGAMKMRETLQGHALTWGDGYAYIARNRGEVTGLWPLRPDRMEPKVERTGPDQARLVYHYNDQPNGIRARMLPDQVLHIAGFGFDGIRGYSPVTLARNSIGLGIATEHYGSAFFGSGSRPSGVLQKERGTLSDKARKRLKSDWEEMHQGLDNAQRVAILEEGLSWQEIGIPPEDAQFLETRKFQVTEAARWLRLPPHKLGDLERATFSNIEEQSLDYVTSTLRPWLVRWEQATHNRVLDSGMRGDGLFAEHLVAALLRGDISTRYEAYKVGRQWGWLNADDIREMENMNPLPDGKGTTYLVPLNMQPVPTDGQQDDPRAATSVRGRGVQARRRLAEAFAPRIADADRTVAELERDLVGELVDEHLDGRCASGSGEHRRPSRARQADEFDAELEDVYEGEVLQAWRSEVGGVIETLSAEAAADAASDVGADTPDLDAWIASYIGSHAGFRVGSSKGQIRQLIRDAEDAAAAIRERLDTWVERRPSKTAAWESVQTVNASARETWSRSGITRIVWQTSGQNCPYCDELSGRVVGIERPFLSAGDEFEPDGADDPLTMKQNIFHPPAHPGCDCAISPS